MITLPCLFRHISKCFVNDHRILSRFKLCLLAGGLVCDCEMHEAIIIHGQIQIVQP